MTVRDEQLLGWPRTSDAVRAMNADYSRYVSFLDLQVVASFRRWKGRLMLIVR